MNYEIADSRLQGRNFLRRKIANNTYLERRNDTSPNEHEIALRLHATDIIVFHKNGDVVLNSGGWRTVTTKARMNEFLEGWGIGQENGQWFIGRRGQRLALFDDGIVLHPDGTFTGGEPIAEYDNKLKLRRKVQRYAARYVKALFAGKVPAPGAGDCFFCQLKSQNGKTMGEEFKDKDHLLGHLDEKYYVPSLLSRAMEVMPVSQVMKWAVAEKWFPDAPSVPKGYGNDYERVALQKVLSRYILRQMGQAS